MVLLKNKETYMYPALCCHSYSYMIDNVVMLITGALKQRDVAELLPRCHPLGAFDQMAAVGIAHTPTELYSAILVDTPLGRFIKSSPYTMRWQGIITFKMEHRA